MNKMNSFKTIADNGIWYLDLMDNGKYYVSRYEKRVWSTNNFSDAVKFYFQKIYKSQDVSRVRLEKMLLHFN